MSKRPAVNSQLATIADLIIDVVLNESVVLDSDVSTFPVETGSEIADNILNKPRQLTMSCLISDTPLPPISFIRGPSSDSDVKPSDYAHKRLVEIRDAREPVTIKTSLGTWKNMVLKNLSITRSRETAGGLFFTAEFVEVEIVENTRSKRVAIPMAKGPASRNQPADKSKLVNRAVDPVNGEWFDPDINGWREGASYNRKEGHWEFFKGRPVHVSESEWNAAIIGTDDIDRLDPRWRAQNEAGLVPVDKKTAVPTQNAGQQFTIVTDAASIDKARAAGVP